MKSSYINTKNILTLIAFLLVAISGITVKQNFFFMLPLFISICVSFLSSEANRYAYLIGGLNSIIYGFVYLNFNTYATALNAFLVSFPVQIVTFINWQKHAYKKSVCFKKMSVKLRIFVTIAFVTIWIASFIVLKSLGTDAAFLDNTSSLIGTLVTILQFFAFIEYTYLWIINAISIILLNIQLTLDDVTKITYLIFSLYSAYCIVLSYISVKKLYKEQNVKGDTQNEM
ncbi:MAG: nicotinamide mononucleotide transporter [Ruminococcaceae bacterium]|nr:nicotinamide mononucleotide transporter [Oscillospiraceae bacterium]